MSEGRPHLSGHVAAPEREAGGSPPMSGSEKGDVLEVSPGTDVCGYAVEAQLGEGGFGTVFRAQRGGERYALKLLPLEEVGEWGVRELLNRRRWSTGM
jgi:serine/threonine protein kinase